MTRQLGSWAIGQLGTPDRQIVTLPDCQSWALTVREPSERLWTRMGLRSRKTRVRLCPRRRRIRASSSQATTSEAHSRALREGPGGTGATGESFLTYPRDTGEGWLPTRRTVV